MNYQNSYRPNSFNLLPPVVKNLLIINGIFFLTTIVMQNQFGLDLADKLGLHFPLSEKFRPYQLITYLFMHGSFMHIFFNMFALWMFGNTLENVWGSKRFLIYYIITGIGAAVCHYTVVYFQLHDAIQHINTFIDSPSLSAFDEFTNRYNMNLHSTDLLRETNANQALQLSVDLMRQYKTQMLNQPVIIGASGAVFGILMAFGMLFPNTLLYIYFAIPIKAKWFVILYGAAELFMGLKGEVGDNVAHFAHLGGMLFGFILIKYWQKQKNRFY